MKDLLNRSWWMLALRGIVAILFGVLALIWPGLTLLWLVILFAVFAIVAGVVSIMAALRARQHGGWGIALLFGIVSVVAGVLAIVFPGITALTLILLIGANALVTGLLDIVMAVGCAGRCSVNGCWSPPAWCPSSSGPSSWSFPPPAPSRWCGS